MLFTEELIQRTLVDIVNKCAYFKPREAEFKAAADVRYIVGPLRLATVYGSVSLPLSKTRKFPGLRQRTRMAVKVIELPHNPTSESENK
jgi:hypothetical protein